MQVAAEPFTKLLEVLVVCEPQLMLQSLISKE